MTQIVSSNSNKWRTGPTIDNKLVAHCC